MRGDASWLSLSLRLLVGSCKQHYDMTVGMLQEGLSQQAAQHICFCLRVHSNGMCLVPRGIACAPSYCFHLATFTFCSLVARCSDPLLHCLCLSESKATRSRVLEATRSKVATCSAAVLHCTALLHLDTSVQP